LDTVLKYPWALPSRSIPSRQWLDLAFSSRGLTLPAAHVETNSPPLLPRIIAGADLISFLPRRMISANRHYGLREIAVPEITLQRDFGVTYRDGGYLSPASRRVLELLVSEGKVLFDVSESRT
jgi:DNA-binding transcriptional LysR family regulator